MPGVVLAGAVAGIVVAGAWVLRNPLAYGSWSPPPARIDYCSRRYYPANPPRHLTLTQVQGTLVKDLGTGPFEQIGTDGWNQPYFARVYDAQTRSRFSTGLCTYEVFVLVGTDDYVSYGLSGGP